LRIHYGLIRPDKRSEMPDAMASEILRRIFYLCCQTATEVRMLLQKAYRNVVTLEAITIVTKLQQSTFLRNQASNWSGRREKRIGAQILEDFLARE
jgi:hypothetical protein